MTESERIFEMFCASKQVQFTRIPERKKSPTPDYEIDREGVIAIVEVKELNRAEFQEIHVGRSTLGSYGKEDFRLSGRIRDACEQLATRTLGKHAGVYACYDKDSDGGIGITDVQIGIQMFWENPGHLSAVQRDSLSAVLFLHRISPTASVYHMPNPPIKLPKGFFGDCSEYQGVLGTGQQLTIWKPM